MNTSDKTVSTITKHSSIAKYTDTVFAKHESRFIQNGTDIVKLREEVTKIARGFDPHSPDGITKFGSGNTKNIIKYSDTLLSQVKAKDIDGVGDKLGEVVQLAKGINVSGLVNGTGSKIPLIGGLIDRFSAKKEKILGKYDSLSTQIDKLVGEISVSQKRLGERIVDLEKTYEFNIEEYHDLDVMIIAGEIKLEELNDEISTMQDDDSTDSMFAQKISDIQNVRNRLDKRIHDLRTMQTVAVQTAPMIRIVQQNNRILIDKFNNLQELTIPSWKKQFTLAVALIEQKKAVELAQKIDDTTNDLMRQNADLLKQNTLSTAKAAQRSVVDIETLEYVQATLIKTVEEVHQIQKDGETSRAQAVVSMERMKDELVQKLSNK